MSCWKLRFGWWCFLILENAVTLGGSQGLQIKALIPVAIRAKDANDKEEILYLLLLLDVL